MKRIFLLSFLWVSFISLCAQAPQAFKYQAVARDAGSQTLNNQAIAVEISITSFNQSEIFYREFHQTKTNEFGLFSINVGKGETSDFKFDQVNWGQSDKWLQVKVDYSGGSNFSDAGLFQLLSVPYALYANTAGSLQGSSGQRALQDTAWVLNGNSGTSANLDFIGTTDFEDVVFRANNSEIFRMKAQGQIGIGTTSPSTSLEIFGDFRVGDGSNYMQVTPIGDLFFKSTADYLVGPVDWVFRYQLDEDYGLFFNVLQGEYQFKTTGQDSIFEVDMNSGRVHVHGSLGVGTPTPQAKLDVRGGTLIGDASVPSNDYAEFDTAGHLEFQNGADYLVGPDRFAFRYSNNQDYGLFFNASQLQYQFKTSGGLDVATIGANTGDIYTPGKIGVGVPNPTAKLEVLGSAQIGGVSDFAQVSNTGDLQFSGNADYLVGNNRYAFRYAANQNFGLFFNSSTGSYEFHDATSAPAFAVRAVTGDGFLTGTLGVGTNSPVEQLQVNGAINIGNTSASNVGSIRWSGSDFEGYDGASWLSFTQDSDPTNELQDLNMVGNFLFIDNGTALIDFAPYLDNTDAQTLSIAGNQLSISNGNSVTLPAGGGSGSDNISFSLNADGSASITDGAGTLTTAAKAWLTTGNFSTNPTNNFIGTRDAQDLVFRTGNQEEMRILNTGEVLIGATTPVIAGDYVGIDGVGENWVFNSYGYGTLANSTVIYGNLDAAANGGVIWAENFSTNGDMSTILGESEAAIVAGVEGRNNLADANSVGVFGLYNGGGNNDGIGVQGTSRPFANAGYGGYFEGNFYGIYTPDDMGAGGLKPFVIDHPLDPENKILRHYAIEAPEVLNMYRGTVELNTHGMATIELPSYFKEINKNFSYHLTPVGQPGDLYISKELENGKFSIAGGAPSSKVSWIVYAERNDRYVKAHPEKALPEIEKKPSQKGKYFQPEVWGQPKEKGMKYREIKEYSRN